MALLIDIGLPDWLEDETLHAELQPLLPGVRIHLGPPSGPLPDVTMLACTRLFPGRLAHLPNLRLIQKLGAGVETMVSSPDLPAEVRIARLSQDIQGREIAEYCLTYVLAHQRNLFAHVCDQADRAWRPRAPRRTAHTTVAVLGLGHIGAAVARLFASVGFRTLGWSRSAKALSGIETFAGHKTLSDVLGQADYVAAILPSTPETRRLFDSARLARMKPGAVLVNVGRGDLIDEDALIRALDEGTPGQTVLDVLGTEPLPSDSPLWAHPSITVTPHVSGWHLDSFADVAENYRRLTDGRRLLNEVDRSAGY